MYFQEIFHNLERASLSNVGFKLMFTTSSCILLYHLPLSNLNAVLKYIISQNKLHIKCCAKFGGSIYCKQICINCAVSLQVLRGRRCGSPGRRCTFSLSGHVAMTAPTGVLHWLWQ